MSFANYSGILFAMAAVCGAQQRVVAPKVVMGDSHGVWLKADGTVWVWGGNGQGQLGIAGDHAYLPVMLPGLTAVRDVAAGDSFSAAVGSDGALWTWGASEDGGLGTGAKKSPRPAPVASLNGVSSVAAGGSHMLALRSDGTVWEWGTVTIGGHSEIPRRVADFTGAIGIAASRTHAAVLKSDGTVWIWGDHGAGDLGNGNYGVSSAPLPVSGLSDVAAVAAGYQFTVALKKDGTVWCVGYGAAGQMGNGAEQSSTKPVVVSGLTGVKAVAAGYMHALALKDDGTVWSWGYNHEHQLGNPRLNAEQSAKPLRSGTLAGVVAIGAAASHSAAITSQGVAWVWGQNDGGSLGADPEVLRRSDVPMRVGAAVPGECRALFSCSTESGKLIQICGEQDDSRVDQWTGIQYRFGPQSGPPELVFPEDPDNGPPALFFSHEETKGDYRVSVRFSTGRYTYRVYSGTKSGAGVLVENAAGKALSDVSCNERPEMFIEYMRLNMPCDPKNPHGAAACKESPYRGK